MRHTHSTRSRTRRRALLATGLAVAVTVPLAFMATGNAVEIGPDGPREKGAAPQASADTGKSSPTGRGSTGESPDRSAAVAPQWKLMWQPDPARDGLEAFEGIEDDRAGSHPGVRHIYVRDGAYRFDMHLRDRDTSTDRQRNEVKGMHAGGRDLEILRGQTWRFSQSMYIPDTLRATKSFTHIMQFKEPGNGTSPIITASLRNSGGTPTIELNSVSSGRIVGRADLAPLQNKWITMQLDVTFEDGTGGRIRWTVKNGSTTVADASASGLDTWLGPERARPKWGIYRSLNDSSNLRDTHLLIKGLKAYRQQ